MRRISRDRSRDASFSFANETSPNGSLSISVEGNTAQAFRKSGELRPGHPPRWREVWPQGQSFNIKWRSEAAGRTTSISCSREPHSLLNIASNLVIGTTEGTLSWAIPTTASREYELLMRVTKVSPSLTDTSNARSRSLRPCTTTT